MLVTGHTGFKGAWLSLWLQSLGAYVIGLAPAPPTSPSLYELAAIAAGAEEHAVDVRDPAAVAEVVRAAAPEIVFHLAAQPMFRRSLIDPVLTYEVNVMGTVNVLDAVRRARTSVRAVVVVSSDKSYDNTDELARSFREQDRLGGADPYSSSKAAAELAASAYRRSYFSGEEGPGLATARAGNVIGGGDWGEDRLLSDVARAIQAGEPVRLRRPEAVRPWQHVLNPLAGYLLLAERLSHSREAARAWNFGPAPEDLQSVRWIVERMAALWGRRLDWEPDNAPYPDEAAYRALDSSAAERELGWRPGWGLERALERIVEWQRAYAGGADMRSLSLAQIEDFTAS